MKFIALKLSDGSAKRKLAFYCRMLQVSRQGFYDYQKRQWKPWKHEALANTIMAIVEEDPENDTYGRQRMYEALMARKEE